MHSASCTLSPNVNGPDTAYAEAGTNMSEQCLDTLTVVARPGITTVAIPSSPVGPQYGASP
jgi:hypothetical protein